MAKKRKSVVRFLNTYRFLPGEKDPVIPQVFAVMDTEHCTISEANARSGVAKGTLYKWKKDVAEGGTRRPQWATVSAVIGALGYRTAFVPMSTSERKSVRNGAPLEAEAPKILFQNTMRKVKNGKAVDQVSGLAGH